MAFEVFSSREQGAGFVICIVTIPICMAATALRLMSSRHRAHRRAVWEDLFAILALVFFVAYASMFIYLFVQLNGRSYEEIGLASPTQLVHILKVGWAMSPQYVPNQLFAKLSLVVLFHNLFSVQKTFNRCLLAIVVLQVGWSIPTYLVKFLMCVPVDKIWDPLLPGYCINIGVFLAVSETVNSLLDFALIGLAVWVVTTLQMSTGTKWKLTILFSLGSLSGIIGFVKIGEAYTSAYANQLSGIWDVIQMATSIICCCGPTLKTVLPGFKLFSSIRSALNSSRKFFSSGHDSKNDGSWMGAKSHDTYQSDSAERPYYGGNVPQDDQTWLRLDDNSQRGGANWSSVVAIQAPQVQGGGFESPHQLRRTLEVEQNFEIK